MPKSQRSRGQNNKNRSTQRNVNNHSQTHRQEPIRSTTAQEKRTPDNKLIICFKQIAAEPETVKRLKKEFFTKEPSNYIRALRP